jgi:hypothetical protein
MVGVGLGVHAVSAAQLRAHRTLEGAHARLAGLVEATGAAARAAVKRVARQVEALAVAFDKSHRTWSAVAVAVAVAVASGAVAITVAGGPITVAVAGGPITVAGGPVPIAVAVASGPIPITGASVAVAGCCVSIAITHCRAGLSS